ncbi:hypothetical protein HYU14_00970 [Candidatus Woesearchaeota archaeon]|nr:hypothetical protein [Candidatus Woesearchaeota archaeon]
MSGNHSNVVPFRKHGEEKGHGGGPDIVKEFEEAYEISEKYSAELSAKILNEKKLVGKKVNKKTIDTIVKFLHSDEVASMIRDAIGARGANISEEELLNRYSLPKHVIKDILSNYEGGSIQPDILLRLSRQLSARVHGEMVGHHPATLANLAYEDLRGAQKVITKLYETSGGKRFAENAAAEINNLADPSKVLEHMQGLYQNQTLVDQRAQHSDRLRKPVYHDEDRKVA